MNKQLKLHQSIIGLALLTTLTLVSCGKKADEPTASTSESPAASSAEPASSTSNSAVPAAAQKLGVKPQSDTACPSSAPIKGEVTKKRGNIYRVAKAPDYAKVKPVICFKDTATAEKAGFKAPS